MSCKLSQRVDYGIRAMVEIAVAGAHGMTGAKVAERISSETEALLKIQAILDSLSEDFREQLGQKPLEERHLGEIRKVVGELNAEIERFRV